MKKLFVAIIAIMILATTVLTIVPVGAETTEKVAGPLVITEILNNPSMYEGISRDYTEYMEVMNISDQAIDLYEYKFWYTTASTLDSCPLPDPEKNKWNVFAGAPNEVVLQPGEIVVIWFITGESILPHDDASKPIPATVEYFRKEITADEAANYEYTRTDYEGKMYAYNVDEFKRAINEHVEEIGWELSVNLDDVRIIPWDINIELEAPSAADLEAGRIGNKAHFNMANCSATDPKAVKYWVTERDVTTFDENTEFICTAGVHSGGGWTNKGFHYSQVPGTTDMIYLFDVPQITPGSLYAPLQAELVNIRHSLDPEKYPDTAVIVTTTERPEDEVTTDEVTNPPRDTTTATNKPSTTTKPQDNNTAAPNDTSSDSKGGCGGFTVAAQLFAVLSAAFVFVVVKKKA